MAERIFDYHNNNLIADLIEFITNANRNKVLTDYDYLCAVARIIDKRKAPSSEMTDCSTGLLYGSEWKRLFQQSMETAKRNAGK